MAGKTAALRFGTLAASMRSSRLTFGNPAKSAAALSGLSLTSVALRPPLARSVPLSVEFQRKRLASRTRHPSGYKRSL